MPIARSSFDRLSFKQTVFTDPKCRISSLPCVAIGITASWALGGLLVVGDPSRSNGLVVLEPNKWIGQHFPLSEDIDLGKLLDVGSWTVVLYHHDCPKCQKVVAQYEHELERSSSQRQELRENVALIEMPLYADAADTLFSEDPILCSRKVN